jgi:1,4-dihydroxy-2-naphthoate octaprenyltransferase
MSRWLSAMRLRTLPLAASCVFAGAAFGWSLAPNPGWIFFLALLTTFSLQILSNLANDYGDFATGVDNANRVGPSRAMQSGSISKTEMKRALIISVFFTLLSGISLLFVAFQEDRSFIPALCFFAIGLVAIAAAIKYTVGKNPYGYSGFGDLAVFIFFGLVGVGGNYFLYAKAFDVSILFPAIAVGLFSTAVLNLNNLRDHVNDKAGGKITTVVRLGFDRGKKYHFVLVFLAFSSAVIGVYWNFVSWISLIPCIPLFTQLILVLKVLKVQNPVDLDGELKKVAILTFLYGLLLFLTSGF